MICSLEKQYADIKLLNAKYAKRTSFNNKGLQSNNAYNQLRRKKKSSSELYVVVIYLFKIFGIEYFIHYIYESIGLSYCIFSYYIFHISCNLADVIICNRAIIFKVSNKRMP